MSVALGSAMTSHALSAADDGTITGRVPREAGPSPFWGTSDGPSLMVASAEPSSLSRGLASSSMPTQLATPLYQRLNFEVAARRRVMPHPLIQYAGACS